MGLAADVAAGLIGTLLLLAQVTLLAVVIVGAARSRLLQVPATQAAALIAIILARAGLAQVVELSGRRVATRVMSALRAELVEQRLRPGAADLGNARGTELATGAVQGVDGLETYLARYLPQVVLAVTVPVAVLLWSAVVDLESAVIMLVTLPVIPGTTKGWVTPRPAQTPRQLVIQGGFVVDDGRTGRLGHHARRFGFSDLRGYLQARCDAGYSLPALAQELGVSPWIAGQALATQHITLPSRREQLARQRQRLAQQRIAKRVVELGFPDVRAYLADRLIRQEWLLAEVAAELAAHRATVRRLMRQTGVQRVRRTAKQVAAGGQGRQVQSLGWQARRAGRAGGAWVCGPEGLSAVPVCGAGLADQPDAGRTACGPQLAGRPDGPPGAAVMMAGVPPISRRVAYLAPVGEAGVPEDWLR